VKAEAPAWASTLPQLPRLVHNALADAGKQRTLHQQRLDKLAAGQRLQGRMLALIGVMAAALLGLELYRLFG
jgi:ubiquinone biosynthesis protein